MNRIQVILIMLGAWLALAVTAYAHGGGLDKDGCHNDRHAGEYHCHQGPLYGPSGIAVGEGQGGG